MSKVYDVTHTEIQEGDLVVPIQQNVLPFTVKKISGGLISASADPRQPAVISVLLGLDMPLQAAANNPVLPVMKMAYAPKNAAPAQGDPGDENVS